MERLSIDEVIEHCKRNTQSFERAEKDRVRLGGKPKNFETDDMSDNVMKKYWEHRQVAEWLEQLKSYKDAKENGLLLKLPCKVGTHIYIINHYWIDEGHICGLAECDDVDCACFKVYEDPDTYTMVAFNEFGQNWFLTEEEAEQKLKELQG